MLVVGDHAVSVLTIAFAPDGRGLASAARDGSVRLWDLAGGPTVTFIGHEKAVNGIAISPAGDRLATAAADSTVRLWRLNGQLERSLGPLPAPVWGLGFIAGGEFVAAAVGNRLDAGEPGGVQLWRAADGRLVRRWTEPAGAWAIATTPDEKRLAWSSGSRRITTWELTAQDTHTFPPLRTAAIALALSRDAKLLAAGDDWAIRLWDIRRHDELAQLTGHKGRVLSIIFTPDGRQMLSGGGDQRVITWDLGTAREQQNADWDIGRVNTLAVSPDGLLAAAAGDRGRVVVWDRD